MLERLESCSDSAFFVYFSENMNDLGLPAPESLYLTVPKAVAKVRAMVTALSPKGPRTSLRNVVGENSPVDVLLAAGSGTSALYVGAAVGSLAVAADRNAGHPSTLMSALAMAHAVTPGPEGHWVRQHLLHHPEIINPNHPRRATYLDPQRYVRNAIAPWA